MQKTVSPWESQKPEAQPSSPRPTVVAVAGPQVEGREAGGREHGFLTVEGSKGSELGSPQTCVSVLPSTIYVTFSLSSPGPGFQNAGYHHPRPGWGV